LKTKRFSLWGLRRRPPVLASPLDPTRGGASVPRSSRLAGPSWHTENLGRTIRRHCWVDCWWRGAHSDRCLSSVCLL